MKQIVQDMKIPFLKDLGQYDDIVKWIEAISKEEAASRSLRWLLLNLTGKSTELLIQAKLSQILKQSSIN